MARLFVVMGVAGCGKSTIARGLAAATNGQYLDADGFHSPENVAKMADGIPLTDTDRWPWLARFATAMAATDGLAFGACSALRRGYRDKIAETAGEAVAFFHLDGDQALIAGRMAARRDHFMPVTLLQSQFATLEPLAPDEPGARIDISGGIAEIIDDILTVTGLDRCKTISS